MAGRRFRDAQEEFTQSGSVLKGAKAAAEALEGDEARELERVRMTSGAKSKA